MSHAALVALLLQAAQPRWAALEGMRLGGPVDDILAKSGECWPGDAMGSLTKGMTAVAFASNAFGYALPHQHPPRDSTAIRRALGVGSMCSASLGPGANLTAAAINRRIVAVIVFFSGDSATAIPADSVRRLAYRAWGRPTHHSPNLDTWSSARYRSYLLVPAALPRNVPQWMRTVQLIMLDISACTAFDRRVHRAGATGEVGEC